MSLESRRDLVSATAPRYQESTKKEKQRILDEFTAATGYHRKYAISLLNQQSRPQNGQSPLKRIRPRTYDSDVQAALIVVWEAANRICSKRLVPFLPEIVDALERFEYLSLPKSVRKRLLNISPATVDRLLYEVRHGVEGAGRTTTKPGTLIKNQVPIRTFSEWNDNRPGFLEADLVAHCGDNPGGYFLNTLVMTDIATGWTECAAILFRDQEMVLRGIRDSRERLPFPLLGLDTDNGSEFLNYLLLDYCADEEISFTRSRPYKKNDQCHVEQKNGHVVRQFIGYDRFEGVEPCQELDELYQRLRLYVNFFQPSMKLVSKKREGSKVVRKYDQAQTPFRRVLSDSRVTKEAKRQLRLQYAKLDPVALLQEIQRLQNRLWRHAHIRRSISVDSIDWIGTEQTTNSNHDPGNWQPANNDKTVEAANVSEPSSNGRKRRKSRGAEPLHGHAPRRYRRTKRKHGNCYVKRYWRTRKDPFADVLDEIHEQLEQSPDLSAKALFKALQQKYPWRYEDGQLRTFQRRVKEWRLKKISSELEGQAVSGHNTEKGINEQSKILT